MPHTFDPHEAITVWLGATRYYVGRMTYAVSNFCAILIREWPTLPPEAQTLIQREIEEAFARDDAERAHEQSLGSWGMDTGPKTLGHDCDRRSWEAVRQLWQRQG